MLCADFSAPPSLPCKHSINETVGGKGSSTSLECREASLWVAHSEGSRMQGILFLQALSQNPALGTPKIVLCQVRLLVHLGQGYGEPLTLQVQLDYNPSCLTVPDKVDVELESNMSIHPWSNQSLPIPLYLEVALQSFRQSILSIHLIPDDFLN